MEMAGDLHIPATLPTTTDQIEGWVGPSAGLEQIRFVSIHVISKLLM